MRYRPDTHYVHAEAFAMQRCIVLHRHNTHRNVVGPPEGRSGGSGCMPGGGNTTAEEKLPEHTSHTLQEWVGVVIYK